MHDGVDDGIYESEGNAADQKIKAEIERFFLCDFPQKEMKERAEYAAEGIVYNINIGKHSDRADNLEYLKSSADQHTQRARENVRVLFEQEGQEHTGRHHQDDVDRGILKIRVKGLV